MKKIITLYIILSFGLTQKITNITQKIENGRIVIHYDLSGDNNKEYQINITAEKNGKSIRPYAVVGELKNVTHGKNKLIWWEPVLEGRDLHGWSINLKAEYNLFNMVFVKGGSFQMGSNDGQNDENPIHSVTVSDFYMCETEVTQAQWKAIMNNNPSNWKGDNLPVEKVSWNNIQKFLKKLNKQTGENYRLPTEAEWEYAARGGSVETWRAVSYIYAGSNNINDVAWYSKNSGNKTHPVSQKQPNALGLYDMSGNVWEWCNDWYDEDYYTLTSLSNPQGANSGKYRVLRGGSWNYSSENCRVAVRSRLGPDVGYYGLVFRLVRSVSAQY